MGQVKMVQVADNKRPMCISGMDRLQVQVENVLIASCFKAPFIIGGHVLFTRSPPRLPAVLNLIGSL